jgi:hypothetical protein
MDEYIEQIIAQIQEGLTFQQWLDSLNDDQLTSFANKEDDETNKALVTLALYFAGHEQQKIDFTEEEAEELTQGMAISIACESSVREGAMTRRGEARVADSKAKYKITEAGEQKVKDMLKGREL